MRMRFYGVPLTASLCTNVVERLYEKASSAS
jgi:hypothetical protein